ncbi:MAG: DinB family protein [Gemmataceae bacterium]
MDEQLVETWRIHDRINRYLLDAVADDALGSVSSPKNRSVYKLFAHVHNVRLMWLKAAAPDLLAGLAKLDADLGPKAELASALEASGAAVAELVRRACAAGGKVKGFKPHVTAFVGYLISHESHHRGQAGWALKAAGKPLDKKTAFGLWEWGVR